MKSENKQVKKKTMAVLAIISIIVAIIAIKPSSARATIFFKDVDTAEIPFYEITNLQLCEQEKNTQKDVYMIIDTSKYEPQKESTIEVSEIESKEEPTDLENQDIPKDDNITEAPTQKPDKNPEVPKEEKPSDEKPNNSPDYVGRFRIPSLGVNVACYFGSAQSIVDAQDSAAYFYAYGHAIIADHKHQGFNAIKSATNGTRATLGSTEYKFVAKINGHNTGYSLTDANGNLITNLYPGTLVTYTCNENWQNVTIVFWECANKDDNIDCSKGMHLWNDWEVAWELYDKNGSYYGWDKKVCKLCGEEEWNPRENPSENCPPPEVKEPEEPSEPTTPPIEETEPPTEPAPSEPTTPPEETTPTEPPTEENNSSDEVSNEDKTKSEEPSATEPPVIEETEPSNEETLPDNVVEVIG